MTEPETKICKGPAHPGPIALPVTEEHWYFHRTGEREGQPLSRCKLCVNWDRLSEGSKGLSGLIECQKMQRWAKELIDRCGSIAEAARLSGVPRNTFGAIFGDKQCSMQKRTAMRILTALDEKRREDRRVGATSARFRRARVEQAIIEERLEREIGY